MADDRTPAEIGLVRRPLPDPREVGEDPDLVAAIRQEIADRGPITFARFMERALYEPGHGYYRTQGGGPGRAGDFLTSPEAHPLFGAAIGQLLAQADEALGRPSSFTVTEPGAGSGALGAAMLAGLRDLGSPLFDRIRYRPLEVEDAHLVALRERLERDGLAALITGGPPAPDGETGAILANEVLDALPVHRVVGRPDGIRELCVGWDAGRFVAVETAPSDPRLAARLGAEGVTLEDGQVTEVCLALDGWLEQATSHLARGVVVLIDYAAEPADLHAITRRDGTLRAFARHAVSSDPFRHVGHQDLTATVDLAAVRSAADAAGLDPVGETTQAELLAAVGSGALMQAFLRRPAADLGDALALRSALVRLMDTRGMGGFRVLVFGRGLAAGTSLPGLARAGRRVP